MIGHRVAHYVQSLPVRVVRLIKHSCFSSLGHTQSRSQLIIKWLPGIFVLLLDIFGLPELYDIVSNLSKTKSRSLTAEEKNQAKKIFKNALPLDKIKIDQGARLGPKQMHIAYVSFFTINSYGHMPMHLLIHELVHVWQYLRYGSLYIVHALFAQHSEHGYNYGGLDALVEAKRSQTRIEEFNFEQQADICRDYFLIRNGYRPQWGSAGPEDLLYYEYFVNQIRKS